MVMLLLLACFQVGSTQSNEVVRFVKSQSGRLDISLAAANLQVVRLENNGSRAVLVNLIEHACSSELGKIPNQFAIKDGNTMELRIYAPAGLSNTCKLVFQVRSLFDSAVIYNRLTLTLMPVRDTQKESLALTSDSSAPVEQPVAIQPVEPIVEEMNPDMNTTMISHPLFLLILLAILLVLATLVVAAISFRRSNRLEEKLDQLKPQLDQHADQVSEIQRSFEELREEQLKTNKNLQQKIDHMINEMTVDRS